MHASKAPQSGNDADAREEEAMLCWFFFEYRSTKPW